MTTAATSSGQPGTNTHAADYDVENIRRDFPILQQTINDCPLVYLDNAATTQKPQAVIDALRHYYETDNANIHRGVHELSVRATEAYEKSRVKAQRFIHASRREEIIFTRGTTEAINLVAQAYARPILKSGDEISQRETERKQLLGPGCYQIRLSESSNALHFYDAWGLPKLGFNYPILDFAQLHRIMIKAVI